MQNEELDLLILSVKTNASDQFTEYFKRRIEEKLAGVAPVTVAQALPPLLHSQEQIETVVDIIEKAPKSPAKTIELIDGVNGRFEPINVSTGSAESFTRLPTEEDAARDRSHETMNRHRSSLNLSEAADPVDAALRHFYLKDISTPNMIKAFSVLPDTDMVLREKLIRELVYPRQSICALLFFVQKMTIEQVAEATNMKPASVKTYCNQASNICGLQSVKSMEWEKTEKPVRHLAPGLFWPAVPSYLRSKRAQFILSQVTSSPMFRDLKIVWEYLNKHHPNPHRVDCTPEHFAIGAMYRMYGHPMTSYQTLWDNTGHKAPDIFLSPRKLEAVFTSKDPELWPLLRDAAEKHKAHETLVGAAALLGKCDDFNG